MSTVLPEVASVHWRAPMDAVRLRLCARVWTATTVGHTVPLLIASALLLYLNPLTFPVAAILLGQSESARLPRMLRDRDQLATSAYANVHALRDPGLLVLSATARASDATKTVGALVDHSLALVDELSTDELDKARIAAETAFVRQLETAQGRARSLGWYATVAGDPQFGHVYLDRMEDLRTLTYTIVL